MTSVKTVTALERCRVTLPYLVVLAAGVFLYYAAENFEFEEASGRIGPGAWPKLILLLLLASALWGAVSSALNAGKPAADDADDDIEALVRPPEIYPSLVWFAVGITVVYLAVMPLVGFFLATIAYSFALIWLGHYRRLLQVTLLSVAIAFAFMFVFMRVVYVELPAGVAPFDRLSYGLMAAMGVH
jgi:putative tricarboxylic transport membrane protein